MTEEERASREFAASEFELPGIIRAYLARALEGQRALPQQVHIQQQGQMWQRPGGRPMRFTATQRFAVETVAFTWRARFPVVGPVAIRVVDEYADGEGKLEARVLGVPVQRQAGPETVRGEALRYLAELPWVPYAMARNRELEWRELEERTIEVAALVGGERLAVAIAFDEAGDIVRTASEMRLLKVENRWVPTPWAGDFGDYELVGGIRIPTRAEVYWQLDSGRFVYWLGSVTAAESLDEPFRRNSQRRRAAATGRTHAA